MVKLTAIGLGGFKSIKDLQSLMLNPVNVVIGANGAGKSNLVSFFKLLNAIAAQELQTFVGKSGGAETLLYYGVKESPAFWAVVKFTGKTGAGQYFFYLSATATDSLIFSAEKVSFKITANSSGEPDRLGAGHKETLLMAEGNNYSEVSRLLADLRTFHFHDTSETAAIRRRCYIEDNRLLRSDGGNLAAFLFDLSKRKPEYYRRIRDTIRQIAPFFDDFDLAPLSVDPNSVLLSWKDRDSEYLFGPHQLSDGTLRAMALVALLLQPEEELPGLIVLDEPEIGLHPYAVEILASLIKAASCHTTIIAATQSVGLVNHFEAADVIVVSRDHGQSVFKRLDPAELSAWIEDYTIGELWEKNLIGGTPSR